MEISIHRRNVPPERENKSDRFRVKYNDAQSFQILKVIVTRTSDGSQQTFHFKSEDLPRNDSIHFSTSVQNGKLVIRWTDATPLNMDWTFYTRPEVESILLKAIRKLQERDNIFLDEAFDINERSVTHRLGMYLAELFPDEDVDCEYNRQYNDDSDEYIAKNVELSVIENGLTLKDTEAKTVYPDIIVHRRNTSRNLLAVEVKMAWKSGKGQFDEIKAEAYRKRLDYHYSTYLVLGPGKNFNLVWK